MLRKLLLAAVLLAGASVIGGPGLERAATAQPVDSVRACPERMPDDTPSLICACPPGASSSGSIWGNDIYTADSPICRAAAHAGVIGERGGVVEVRDLPGRSHYPAVTRNGIDSGSWESFPRSITFRGAGDGSGMADCPSRLGSDTPSLVCQCPADAIGSDTVWGSDIYTADSPICRAAVHAGVIGQGGGIVDVHEAPGRDSYPATTHNGVSSSHWDSYPRSIVFRDRGEAPK